MGCNHSSRSPSELEETKAKLIQKQLENQKLHEEVDDSKQKLQSLMKVHQSVLEKLKHLELKMQKFERIKSLIN